MADIARRFKYRYFPTLKAAAKVTQGYVTKKRMPLYTSLFITQRCNLKCVYCFPKSQERRESDIPLDKLFKIVDELYEAGCRFITILGGEPMLRSDFGEIVDYITKKGILAEVSTNGYFIKKWPEAIRKLFLVCNSIDGDEETHDANRGKGSFRKVMESIEFCREHNVPVQLRSVITSNNVDKLQFMLDLAKKVGTTLSLGEQCVDADRNPYEASPEEYREFWKFIEKKKKEGYLIDKSHTCLKNIIRYPLDAPLNKIFMDGEELPPSMPQDMPKCTIRNGFCLLDNNGMLYPCIPLFGKWGKNVFELGVKGAWEGLMEHKCRFCRSSVYDMKSFFFGTDRYSMIDMARYMLNKNCQ
ncbi:MAG: radical SAM protein [Candidatus Omnitrophica bacterium]|nr:radical SAM protein [Candidatus Omnitrophota bacterium]